MSYRPCTRHRSLAGQSRALQAGTAHVTFVTAQKMPETTEDVHLLAVSNMCLKFITTVELGQHKTNRQTKNDLHVQTTSEQQFTSC